MEDLDADRDRREADQLTPTAPNPDAPPSVPVAPWRRALSRPDTWSVVIAATALLLSQLPPVLNLARGTSLELTTAATAYFTTHAIGRPQVNVLVGLENTGGQALTVESFRCNLRQPATDERTWNLEVTSGLRSSANPTRPVETYPLGWIPIRAGEIWSGVIVCQAETSDHDLLLVDAMRVEFEQEIERALASRFFQTANPVTVSEGLHAEASRLFERRFDVLEGDYEIEISAFLARGAGIATTTRRFQLTSFSISQLSALKDEMRYGAGITFPSARAQTLVRLGSVDQLPQP